MITIEGLVDISNTDKMVETAKEFENLLIKLAASVETNLEKIIRKTAIDLWTEIVMASPVDRGRYRASHGIMASEPTGDEPAASDPGKGNVLPAPSKPLSGSEIGFTWEIKDDAIWFYNNLIYAEVIEDGDHSDQAPQGVYNITLSNFNAKLEENLKAGGLI